MDSLCHQCQSFFLLKASLSDFWTLWGQCGIFKIETPLRFFCGGGWKVLVPENPILSIQSHLATLNFLISRSREVVLGSNRDLVCDNPSFTRDQDKRTTTYLPKQEDVEQKVIRCCVHNVFALTFNAEQSCQKSGATWVCLLVFRHLFVCASFSLFVA